MAVQTHSVGGAEGGEPVRGLETVTAVIAEDIFHLHLPLGRELGEMGGGQPNPARVVELSGHGTGADREGYAGLQGGGISK